MCRFELCNSYDNTSNYNNNNNSGARNHSLSSQTTEATFLFQRLSVALQRGNAVSFLGTFPQD